MKIRILSLTLLFTFTFHSSLQAEALERITAAGDTSTQLGNHSGEEEHKEKDKMQLLQALMQAAQAAAAIAAAAGNKKTADKITAAEPMKVPEIPGISPPPPPAKEEEAKLPELAAESPAPEISIEPEPVTTSGVVEFAPPAPLPVEVAVDAPVVVENPQSDIPDTIPNDRAKLGYDERNPTGGSPTPAAPGAPTSNPLSSAALSSAASGTTNAPASLKPEGTEKKDRFVANQTAPESSDGGGDSAGGSGYGSASGGGSESSGDSSNMMDMISQMMGAKPGDGAVAGPSGQHGDAMYSGAGGGGGRGASATGQRETIFEYASFRYRQMAFKEKIIKRDGRKKPAMAGVLSQAHDLFSNVAQ